MHICIPKEKATLLDYWLALMIGDVGSIGSLMQICIAKEILDGTDCLFCYLLKSLMQMLL